MLSYPNGSSAQMWQNTWEWIVAHIKAMRAARNMTQAEYARRLGVPIGNLKQWETDRVQIFKSTWQQIMLRG